MAPLVFWAGQGIFSRWCARNRKQNSCKCDFFRISTISPCTERALYNEEWCVLHLQLYMFNDAILQEAIAWPPGLQTFFLSDYNLMEVFYCEKRNFAEQFQDNSPWVVQILDTARGLCTTSSPCFQIKVCFWVSPSTSREFAIFAKPGGILSHLDFAQREDKESSFKMSPKGYVRLNETKNGQ